LAFYFHIFVAFIEIYYSDGIITGWNILAGVRTKKFAVNSGMKT